MSTVPGARHFHEDLAHLKSRLLEMSERTEELVRDSVEVLLARDEEGARLVIEADSVVDRLEIEIDEVSMSLLALQQPMARDLRLITMVMKISNDLERVGDHAVNIARSVRHMSDGPPFRQVPEIDEMARIAREMLSDALDHFVRGDSEGARAVCARDDRVDALHDSLFRSLLTHMMEDPRRIGSAMSMIMVSKNLERIADLATNISEDVVYMVEGRVIKHNVEARR